MAVSIDVEVEGQPVNGGYKVTWTVKSSTDMPQEVFLLNAPKNSFERVIDPSDLQWPTSRDVKQAFYRKSQVSETYDTITDAENAKTNVDSALQDIVDKYKNGLSSFTGTSTNSYS